MSVSERLAYLITANADDAIHTFEKVGAAAEKDLGKAENRIQKLGHQATVVGAGMLAFAGVAGVALGEVAKASEESTHSQVLLQATLANAPQLAGHTAEEFNRLAESLQAKTAADHVQITSGIAVLANFNLTAAEIKALTPLVVDFARRTGQDVPSAAELVGKALLGQGRALKGLGIDFKNTGTESGNFAEVVTGLRDKVGGFAEREGKTLSGQLAILKNQFKDLEEGVGVGVVSAFTKALKPVSEFSGWLGHTSPQTQSFVGTVAAIGTATIGAVGGLSLMAGQVAKMHDRFVVTDGAAAGTLTTFGKFAAGAAIVGGLASIGAGVWEISRASLAASVNVEKLARATDDELVAAFKRAQEFGGGLDMALFTKTAEQSIGTAERLRNALAAQGQDVTKLDAAISRETASQRQAATDAKALAGATDDGTASTIAAAAATEQATAAMKAYTDSIDGTLAADLNLGDASSKLADDQAKLADDIAHAGDAADATTGKVRTYQDALADIFDAAINVDEAQVHARESATALGDALKATGQNSEDAAAFMKRYYEGAAAGASDKGDKVRLAADAAVRAAEAEVDAEAKSGLIADTAGSRKAALAGKLEDLKRKYPAVTEQINHYLEELKKVPNLTTNAETTNAKLGQSKRDLAKDTRDLVRDGLAEVEMMVKLGTVADTPTARHGALLFLLGKLKEQYPKTADAFQKYIDDLNKAWSGLDPALKDGFSAGGGGAFGGHGASGSWDANASAGHGASGSWAPAKTTTNHNKIDIHVNGDGLDAQAVATMTARQLAWVITSAGR